MTEDILKKLDNNYGYFVGGLCFIFVFAIIIIIISNWLSNYTFHTVTPDVMGLFVNALLGSSVTLLSIVQLSEWFKNRNS